MSTVYYDSPVGKLRLSADFYGLTEVLFCTKGHWENEQIGHCDREQRNILYQCMIWLDKYFASKFIMKIPLLHLQGTVFQVRIWHLLQEIPCGCTVSYGEIAKRYCTLYGISKMSSQAVGAAVGQNPVAIIVPCHRVIGANGTMTGYAGGIWRKELLLRLEKTESLK